jgi:hypothetical protein
LFKISFFVIPGVLVQMEGAYVGLAILVFYILSLWIMGNLGKLYRNISDVNKAYKKYVIEENIFGDYD